MTGLKLLADDLTGALDTAAQFVGKLGPVPVYWDLPPVPCPDIAAIDCATRELPDALVGEVLRSRVVAVGFGQAGTSYLKVDSLLRGHAGLELASCLRAVPRRACLIAPAFPFQGRVTRGGRQFGRFGEEWTLVGEDLAATLAANGIAVTTVRAGDAAPVGVSLWDAETDADLRAIVDAARTLGPDVLWCGSGGLAGALAGDRAPTAKDDHWDLSGPILGLFGTDHPVTTEQLRRAGALRLTNGGAVGGRRVMATLASQGAALVAFDLPEAMSRDQAAKAIIENFTELTRRLEPPATLIAGGGETLRGLCRVLGARCLDVTGQLMPGVPRSVLRGGRWDGVTVISKSGAFGQPDLLYRLLQAAPTFGKDMQT